MLLEKMSDRSRTNGSSSSASSSSSSSSSSSANSSTLSEELATVLQAVNEVYNDIEGGMEDESIQWQGKRLIFEDLSDDDAIFHFRFRKKHLQELANKLWPQLQPYLTGLKPCITFDHGRYSCPYETLFSRLCFVFQGLGVLGRKWRASLGYGDPRFLRGFTQWSMHCIAWS